MFTRWKFQIGLTAIAVVLAALSGAFFDEGVAYTQGEERDYVDVGLILEIPDTVSPSRRYLNVVVTNHGSRTAYDVTVVGRIVSPKDSIYFTVRQSSVSVGTVSFSEDGYSFFWTIPALGGKQRVQTGHDGRTQRSYHLSVRSAGTNPDGIMFDKKLTPYEVFATVTTASFESDLHKSNNTARAWSHNNSNNTDDFRQAWTSYSANVSVDERHPSPGDTVNFTITANNADTKRAIIDQKVDIELTDGLAVAGTPSYDPATNPYSVSYSNGVFNIGTLDYTNSSLVLALSVTLPIKVSDNVVVNEQCLTATITGNPPPPGPNLDDISDNVAKLCLGEPPVEPLLSGQVDAFTIYPCVGNTNSPCDATDDVRVRAYKTTDESILGSGKALVHILEEDRRKYDSHTNSVNAGTVVSWQIPVIWNANELDAVNTQWSNISDGFAASGINGGAPPGKVHIRAFEGETWAVIYKMTPDTTPKWIAEESLTFNPGTANGPYEYIAEFEKLGTYKLQFDVKLTRAALDGDEDCDPNTANPPVNQRFCATETYIFHVGPIAELEVRDGGASSQVAAARSTLKIVAANNGPDSSPGARVTGLPTGAEVLHISQGSYDGSTGVWNIGEMKLRDYYPSRGEPNPSLVLAATAGDTAEVSIINHEKYKVCIGSDASTLAHTTQTACEEVTGASWHEGTVYDYKAGNNTATISARGGGVSGTSGGPGVPRFANAPVLAWEAVPHVNNWPVDRYQVQYLSGNNWEDLGEVRGTETHFADRGAGSGRAYRVRALNEAGVPGFWSRSASQVTYRQASPPVNVTAVAGDAGTVVVSWQPSADDGGSTITHYQAQWSRNGASGWSNACRTDSAAQHSCTNTGIPSGETRYYRVAAYAGGLGVWSDHAVATAVSGLPEAPRLSASRATQGSGDSIIRAIRLTWNEPRDNGSTVYAYEIEWADYDQVARTCGTDWQYLDVTGGLHSASPPAREYVDAGDRGYGLDPGAHRCYRVRAINSAEANDGAGAWSNVAHTSAGGEVPPDLVYLDGEADGQSAITLYWYEPHFDGGARVTGYQLQHSEDGENWRNLTSTSASARSYTHTGRQMNEASHYRIRARNSAGWGEWSYPISVVIQEGTTANLAQPTLTVRATTSTEILLSWTRLCDPNREGDCESKGVDGYLVEYSEDGGAYGWERLAWAWTYEAGLVDSTVEPGATRYYRVVGYDEVNGRDLFGRWSQVKSATTADFRVGEPKNLTIVAEGERGLRLEWDEVTEGRDASSITGYRIERTTNGGDDTSWAARQTNRTSGPYVETGLAPDSYYCYRVAAVTRNGSVPYIGPYSTNCAFTPRPGG